MGQLDEGVVVTGLGVCGKEVGRRGLTLLPLPDPAVVCAGPVLGRLAGVVTLALREEVVVVVVVVVVVA